MASDSPPTAGGDAVERYADRLRRRGVFHLSPTTRNVKVFEGERDGHLVTEYTSEPAWHIAWWPHGQGPGRRSGGNPFCQRSYIGLTVEDVLRQAFEGTTPDSDSLDVLVWRAARNREAADA